MSTMATLRQAQEALLTIQTQVLLAGEPSAVSGMAQQARSPPAVAGSRTTRERIQESRLAITMCTRVRTAVSIAITNQLVCSNGRVRVGKQCNVRRIGIGYRINRTLVGLVKCGRGETYK